MSDAKVVDINKYSQGWQYVEVRRVGFQNIFKVDILRDSYLMQCSARLAKWTSDGWQLFYAYPVNENTPFMQIHPAMSEDQFFGESRDWAGLFVQTAEALWQIQKDFFGPSWHQPDYSWKNPGQTTTL